MVTNPTQDTIFDTTWPFRRHRCWSKPDKNALSQSLNMHTQQCIFVWMKCVWCMVIVDRMRCMWWSVANCFQNVRKKRKDFVISEKIEWRTGTKFRAQFPLMDGWSIASRLSVATVRTLGSWEWELRTVVSVSTVNRVSVRGSSPLMHHSVL